MEEVGGFKGSAREEMLNGDITILAWERRKEPYKEVCVSSKACEYSLFVARSSIGRGPGIGIFLISLSLLVDCRFQSLCQEDKINER